jgi:hypothetical protein
VSEVCDDTFRIYGKKLKLIQIILDGGKAIGVA